MINSLSDLKAHIAPEDIDFKGRPFITELRLNNDPEVLAYFNLTRSQWTKVPGTFIYKLADSVTVR